jgi:hypothetical protein
MPTVIIQKLPKEYTVRLEGNADTYIIPSITRALRKAKELFEMESRQSAAAAALLLPLSPLSPAAPPPPPPGSIDPASDIRGKEVEHEPRNVVLEGVQVSDKAATGDWKPGPSFTARLQEIRARQVASPTDTHQQPDNSKEQTND